MAASTGLSQEIEDANLDSQTSSTHDIDDTLLDQSSSSEYDDLPPPKKKSTIASYSQTQAALDMDGLLDYLVSLARPTKRENATQAVALFKNGEG